MNEVGDFKSSYTQKEIDQLAESIQEMSHEELARKWRFAPSGTAYFRKDLKTSSGKTLYELFKQRFTEHFNGFTPEISKKIGWG